MDLQHNCINLFDKFKNMDVNVINKSDDHQNQGQSKNNFKNNKIKNKSKLNLMNVPIQTIDRVILK